MISTQPPVYSGNAVEPKEVPPNDTNEDLIFSIYCVVYQLQHSNWTVLGNGWSQLHLCKHRLNNTYRLVGMSVQSQRSVINVNLTHACKYRKKSSDFHKLTCSNGDVWGFGFFSSPSSLDQATMFFNTMEQAHHDISHTVAQRITLGSTSIGPPKYTGNLSASYMSTPVKSQDAPPIPSRRTNINSTSSPHQLNSSGTQFSLPVINHTVPQKSQTLPPSIPSRASLTAPVAPPPPKFSQGPTAPVAPQPNNTQLQHSLSDNTLSPSKNINSTDVYTGPNLDRSNVIPTAHLKQLGALQVLPPKMLASLSDESITTPLSVRHTAHVAYNHKKGTYEGLPEDWEKHLDQVYGVPLEKLDMVLVSGYEHRLPKILVELTRKLFLQDAINSVGVFRLAPDQSESEAARKRIDAGELIGSAANAETVFNYDVNVLASLMKIWFRALPVKLWDGVNKARVEACESEFEAWQIVQSLSQPFRVICEFLIDVCVTICKNEKQNKMTSQNLSICISPN